MFWFIRVVCHLKCYFDEDEAGFEHSKAEPGVNIDVYREDALVYSHTPTFASTEETTTRSNNKSVFQVAVFSFNT